MDGEAVDGWWWIPGRESDRRFGRMSAGASDPWKLDVYGGLDDHSGASDFLSDEMKTAAVIHGHRLHGSPGQRFVSLVDCWQTSSNITYGGAADGERAESWTFQEVISGPEVATSEGPVIEIRVRLSNLLKWSGRPRPRPTRSDVEVSASSTSMDVGTAEVPGGSIDLVLDHDTIEGETELTIRHQATFRVVPDEPLSFRTAMSEFALPLRSLLSFLTIAHVDVDSVRGLLEPGNDDRRRLWFYYQTALQRPLAEPKRPQAHEMLVTWPDMQTTVQELLSSWFELHARFERTIQMLLLPHHAPYLYADDRLMTAFVAVEAFHNERIGGTALDSVAHDKRVDAIVEAAPLEHRSWTNEMLRGRNAKGQRRKLTEVLDYSGATGQAVLEAAPRFVDLALRSRHQVAHPSGSDRVAGAEYLAASYGLRWILRHCLLVELGIDDRRAAELIARCKPFSDELELVRRWTEPH